MLCWRTRLRFFILIFGLSLLSGTALLAVCCTASLIMPGSALICFEPEPTINGTAAVLSYGYGSIGSEPGDRKGLESRSGHFQNMLIVHYVRDFTVTSAYISVDYPY